MQTTTITAAPTSHAVAYDAGYSAGYAAGLAARPKPRTAKPRKAKPPTQVAAMLKLKFSSLCTDGDELSMWREAMEREHGQLVDSTGVPIVRQPGVVTGPMLVHGNARIDDLKAASKYVRAL